MIGGVKIIPVVVAVRRMIRKTLTEYLNITGNIIPNKLQVEAVRGSVKILKRVLGMRL